jgi:hypothetical protein
VVRVANKMVQWTILNDERSTTWQSILWFGKNGLLRRYAPRNDDYDYAPATFRTHSTIHRSAGSRA